MAAIRMQRLLGCTRSPYLLLSVHDGENGGMSPIRTREFSRIPQWLQSRRDDAAGWGALTAVATWLLFWFGGD
jgi:hypothetical protein